MGRRVGLSAVLLSVAACSGSAAVFTSTTGTTAAEPSTTTTSAGAVSSPVDSVVATTSVATTTSVSTVPATTPEGEAIPPTTQPLAGGLLDLMYEVDLPWSWDSWTIEAYEGRYESTFVTYQGEIVFSLQMFGHDRALPDPIDIGFDEGDVRELWAGHLSDPSFDPYREDHIHTIEEVRFLGRPAYYSYWVGPAQGPAERNFVDLYIARSLTGYWIFISATSDEWTDIDASKVAAFAPVFREFISQHAEAPAT